MMASNFNDQSANQHITTDLRMNHSMTSPNNEDDDTDKVLSVETFGQTRTEIFGSGDGKVIANK